MSSGNPVKFNHIDDKKSVPYASDVGMMSEADSSVQATDTDAMMGLNIKAQN